MDSITSSILVPLFFVHATVGMVILAWWFLSQKAATLKEFGWGLAGYAAGMAIWTVVVFNKPDNLKPLILLGVIPFLLAHLAYAKAASAKLTSKTMLPAVTATLLVATFIARTFF